MHLVGWNQVCQPASQGGLGIGKWLWRFSLEKSSLWHKVTEVRYGLTGLGWDSKIPQGAYGTLIFGKGSPRYINFPK